MLTRGIYTALVTPFTQEGSIDKRAFSRLLSIQEDANISGIIVGGTTGESATLVEEELCTLIQESMQYRMPIIAGIGSANTAHSVSLAKRVSSYPIKALLVVMPYYNKPTQEGMFQHIESIVKVTDIPIILYNVPSRTVSSITPETVARLKESFPNQIIGIKEATQDMLVFTRLRSLCGEDFLLFTGDDATLYPSLTVGSSGAISVISNIIPKMSMRLMEFFDKQEYSTALDIHEQLQEYIRYIFIETNPIPIKYALWYKGYIENYLRLPLTPLSIEYRKGLEKYIDSIQE